MAAAQHSPVFDDGITPEVMAKAGVPLALARWYHVIARHLPRFGEWDIERVMQVRLQVAQSQS
jgi:hypothetical protein